MKSREITWHKEQDPTLSTLAIELALAASSRANYQAQHEWVAENAKRFDGVLNRSAGVGKVTGGGNTNFTVHQILEAVNLACTCGCKDDGYCKACEVWHRLTKTKGWK